MVNNLNICVLVLALIFGFFLRRELNVSRFNVAFLFGVLVWTYITSIGAFEISHSFQRGDYIASLIPEDLKGSAAMYAIGTNPVIAITFTILVGITISLVYLLVSSKLLERPISRWIKALSVLGFLFAINVMITFPQRISLMDSFEFELNRVSSYLGLLLAMTFIVSLKINSNENS